MTAKIIFSDGSKALAHNLDDLRERWMLRRQSETLLVGTKFDDIVEVDYQTQNRQDAVQWGKKAFHDLKNAEMDLTQLNRDKRLMPIEHFNAKRETLIAEVNFRQEVHRTMVRLIKTLGVSVSDASKTIAIAKWKQLYAQRGIELSEARKRIAALERELRELKGRL